MNPAGILTLLVNRWPYAQWSFAAKADAFMVRGHIEQANLSITVDGKGCLAGYSVSTLSAGIVSNYYQNIEGLLLGDVVQALFNDLDEWLKVVTGLSPDTTKRNYPEPPPPKITDRPMKQRGF